MPSKVTGENWVLLRAVKGRFAVTEQSGITPSGAV